MPNSHLDSNSDSTPSEHLPPSLLTLIFATWSLVLWLGFVVAAFVIDTAQGRSLGHTFVVIGLILAVLALISHALPEPKRVGVEAGRAVNDETSTLRR
jgi:hypothetical protein